MKKILTILLSAVIVISSCATASLNLLPDKNSLPEQTESTDIISEENPVQNTAQSELSAAQEESNAVLNEKKKPMIALTFDDGPCELTDSILDILERYNVRATFFVQGQFVEKRQDTIRRAVKNGNEVAGHTWRHNRLSDLSNKDMAETIVTTSAIIEQITGVPSPRFFRPPYGHIDWRVKNVCAGLGYALINWTVDPQDWRLLNADKIYIEVMNTVRENSIVLLHDIFSTTKTAAERIIPALIEKGYELVTVSELMSHLYEELKPGTVYGAYGLRH